MSAFDFNTAPDQRDFELIPDKTVAVVQLKIRDGNAGEGGLFKRTKKGDAEGLDCEFVVAEGPYAKRKFWGFFLLDGATDGQKDMARANTGTLRAILESARGIKPADVSEAAKKARVAEYRDFDGIRFIARIGVEPAKGDYKAKNILAAVVTPDQKEWHPIEQVEQPLMHATPAAGSNVIPKPAWAS
jgi:hypothetical protein